MMRSLSGLDWGANRSSLIAMHYALEYSALDYGSMIYGSVSATQLKSLNRVQMLVIASGEPVELREMPLVLGKEKTGHRLLGKFGRP